MKFYCEGCDDEFKFKVGDEIIYSEDNYDYTIVRRIKHMVGGCKCLYQLKACDPTNPRRTLQITIEEEDKMTLTNVIDVLTKLWPNLEMTSSSQMQSLVMNKILGLICSPTDVSHSVEFKSAENSFTLVFEGIEFTKNL